MASGPVTDLKFHVRGFVPDPEGIKRIEEAIRRLESIQHFFGGSFPMSAYNVALASCGISDPVGQYPLKLSSKCVNTRSDGG